MSDAVVIVQARMGSTRLPGKVLLLIDGRPMFSYQIERLRRVRGCEIVVATTHASADDAIVDFCRHERVACVRGSEQDVLSRYILALDTVSAAVVVRVTSDCPLLDPALVALAIGELHQSGCDYVSNMIEPTWPYGMAVEAMTAAALRTANAESRDAAEREHVTPFIYWRPERFAIRSLTMQPDLSRHRWTVDTPEDFELVSRILSELYPKNPEFEMADVLALLSEHSSWSAINAGVNQKTVVRENR